MSDTVRHDTLDAALHRQKQHPSNWEFIREVLAGVEIEGYYSTSQHIQARRRDGGPTIQIYASGSTGFFAEEVDGHDVWDSTQRAADGRRLVGVTHPVSRTHPSTHARSAGCTCG